MGDAQKRLEKSGEKVPFDAAAIGLRIVLGDHNNLAGKSAIPCARCGFPAPPQAEARPDLVEFRAFAMISRAAVAASFPQGMDRKDGRVWAAWQDIFDDEIPGRPVTRAQVEWLARHVNGEAKTADPLARWRESVGEYLTELALEPALEQNGAHDPAGAPTGAPTGAPAPT